MLQSEFITSSIGKKIVIAVTGLFLFGFVIGHLAGNLLIFAGPDALNSYARKLRDLAPLVWSARFVLLASVVFHIWTSILLTIENRAARPIGYEVRKTIQTSIAARTMMLSGLVILAFIIYHLLHFTFRVTHPEISHLTDSLGRHDVYSMVVLSFQKVYISAVYGIAMTLLCLHLAHGASSWLQTLGWNNERTQPLFVRISAAVSLLILIGYVSIPISVLCGVVK
ncbi:MAG: hypothetical protein A3G87_03105 [Omnitrophica bacterium RIFCSPLOWO2_12_FULL_50_11]|nr:MAG: hypothetical protein A3G87_03105 [Omnitrophica bacterium RIFCSPLOWO2_12_FULL_50_11]